MPKLTEEPQVIPPRRATLRRHGLMVEEWREMAAGQGWACAVCGRKMAGDVRSFCVDHEHVRGWRKMKPAIRRKHVRGILCFFCNHYYVSRSITIEKAEAVVRYLRAYEERKSP